MFNVGDKVIFEGATHVDTVTAVEDQNHAHYGAVTRIHCGNFSAFDFHFSPVIEGKDCPRCGVAMEKDCDDDWICADCLYIKKM